MTADDEPMEARGFTMVLAYLEGEIMNGRLRAGSQLPPERELAADLHTSRGAVREAIRALQAQGLVTTDSGPRNGSHISTSQGDALGRILRLHLALGASSMPDLHATRVILERAGAASAALNATDEQRQRLIELCEQMKESPDTGRFNDLDTEFHVGIARASGNELAADLTVALRYAERVPILHAERAVADWPAMRALLVAQHDEICQAIVEGRADDASEIVVAHIQDSYARLQPQWIEPGEAI